MSQRQCEAAVIEVGNQLFDRSWKLYNEKLKTDQNTLPAGSNMRRTEPYLEAMALSSIVEEIMKGNDATVLYSNDGSAMNQVGSYVVQSLTINDYTKVFTFFWNLH